MVRRSPRTLKQYARCTNYDVCGGATRSRSAATSSRPARSASLWVPLIVAMTRKGPWRICLDPECSTKDKSAKAGAKAEAKAGAKGSAKPAKKRSAAQKRPASAPRKKSS